jgi:anaerobic selenocysteine-containing dehydrogenase
LPLESVQELIRAKIPGPTTGITVKQTFCDICAPGNHCGIDVFLRDGRIIKVEGTPGHPHNNGKLCTKGLASRQYVYRQDRLRVPLRRIGPRGEGRFEEISWEEAYAEIAERLNGVKDKFGANSVVFFTGYSKWYRPFYQRFAFSFGSVNYCSDDSVCNNSGVMGMKTTGGRVAMPDLRNTRLFLGWAYGGYYSSHLSPNGVKGLKARGGKVIIVDPRVTPAVKHFADLHLQLKTGTDGALALGMANIIIENNWVDWQYVNNHTYGFDEYAAYVRRFDPDTASRLTGVPKDLIYEAARLFAQTKPACLNPSGSTVAHHINGFQNYRAIVCLLGLTGNYDVAGGNVPGTAETYIYKGAGFPMKSVEFSRRGRPRKPIVGGERFPLWDELNEEAQDMDLTRQLETGEPYPLKALFALGLNLKMFPDTERFKRALAQLDFIVDVDLFQTDSAKWADIVLPVCSSFERTDFKVYGGGWAQLVRPVIAPLYESKSDTEILFDLVKALGIKDPLLEKGYDACLTYMLRGSGLTLDELKAADNKPIRSPRFAPYVPGTYTKEGYDTPSGKFEFASQVIAKYKESHNLDALPTYRNPFRDEKNPEESRKKYPIVLTVGARIPFALHSRFHDVPWTRSFRPEPQVDVNRADAEEKGIAEGDLVELFNPTGRIRLRAHLTDKVAPGQAALYHGYTEANGCELVDAGHLDPYSGFPAYKSNLCDYEKVKGGGR